MSAETLNQRASLFSDEANAYLNKHHVQRPAYDDLYGPMPHSQKYPRYVDYDDYSISHAYNQMSYHMTRHDSWEGKIYHKERNWEDRRDPRMSGRARHSSAHLSPAYQPRNSPHSYTREGYNRHQTRAHGRHSPLSDHGRHENYEPYEANLHRHELNRQKPTNLAPNSLPHLRRREKSKHSMPVEMNVAETPPANAQSNEHTPSYSNMARRKPVRPRVSLKASPILKAQTPSPSMSAMSSNRTTPQPNSTRTTPMTTPCAFSNRTTPSPCSHHSYDDDMLTNLVRAQLECYFSDKNLFEEQHSNLQFYMKLDPENWVAFHVIAALPEVRKLTNDPRIVQEALKSSGLLEYDEQNNKVRRPGYVTPADIIIRKSLRRSVLAYNLPKQMTDIDIRKLLDCHGNILCVAFEGMEEGPDEEVGNTIMKKKITQLAENPASLHHRKTAFVVFESQSQANKCVKARSRNAEDGIQTIHKYDYNKVIKRLYKGVSPLFTPQASPCVSDRTPLQTPTSSSAMMSPAVKRRSPPLMSRSAQSSPVAKRSNYRRGVKTPDASWNMKRDWRLDQRFPQTEIRRQARKIPVNVARGPDGTRGFRWPRNPAFHVVARNIFDGTAI